MSYGYCESCDYCEQKYRFDNWDLKTHYYCERDYRDVDKDDYCVYHRQNGKSTYLYEYKEDEEEDDDEYNSFCYITTASCNILGYSDDNTYLNTLRDFRNNVMRKDPKYFELLVLYDIVGPTISFFLENDSNKEEIATNVMENVINACDLLKNGIYDEAINLYCDLTIGLAEYYGIEIPVITYEEIDNIDIDKSGTGKLYQKKK